MCDTEVFYDLFKVNHTRTQHSGSFVGICHRLDLINRYFVEHERKKDPCRPQLVEQEPSIVFVILPPVLRRLAEEPPVSNIFQSSICHRWFLLDQLSTPQISS